VLSLFEPVRASRWSLLVELLMDSGDAFWGREGAQKKLCQKWRMKGEDLDSMQPLSAPSQLSQLALL
jgi:hypothetical protein